MAVMAVALAPAVLTAQEAANGVDPLEIARQIRRNMVRVEESLHEMEGRRAREAAREAASAMDELVQGSRRRGEQIIKDIDALISTFKP
jgi:pyruvate kinase